MRQRQPPQAGKVAPKTKGIKYNHVNAMKTWLLCEMSNIFVVFVCQMLVGQPWCLCFYWFLPLHLGFSTYYSPSESDCVSEPAQTLAPEMRGIFFFFFKSNFATANKIIATLSGYTIVTLTLTYQLLSLGKISGGCVCSLGSSEPLLYHSGVWCDCWWSYTGSLGMGSAPCWGVLVGTLLAPLSKALQERFYTYIRI